MVRATDLDSYLTTYGDMLGQSSGQTLIPLHSPATDEPVGTNFLRPLFAPQAHVCTAGGKALLREKAILLVAECGSGKTPMAMGVADVHAKLSRKSSYRAVVMCPPQLVLKWIRELREVIPGVRAHEVRHVRDLIHLDRNATRSGIEYYVMSEQTAKGDVARHGAYDLYEEGEEEVPRCPSCGRRVLDRTGLPVPPAMLDERQYWCEDVELMEDCEAEEADESGLIKGCGSALWQYDRTTRKWPPATFIHKKLKGFFDYAIFDESHELKSPTSARANAMGTIAAACGKSILLTGTLLGGYAWHLRTVLLRVAPTSMVEDGFTWSNVTAFNQCYGRIETRVTTKDGDGMGDRNKRTKGGQTKAQSVRPGVMPTIFGRHLMDKAVFLSLDELAENLPLFKESVIPVEMDSETAAAYKKTEDALRSAVAEMVQHNDRRLLSAMLQTLLGYADHPYGWGEVGYYEGDQFICVTKPKDLDPEVVRPKDKELLDLVLAERREGRQVWVGTTMTGKRDVAARLDAMFLKAGLRSRVLRSSVETRKREEWISKFAPDVDVMISHPQLVQTGLDLFDKGGRHNFPTIAMHQTGYSTFVCRQFSRRAWRIGQQMECRVFYLYYRGTMQEQAMSLMGQKLTASEAIEGKFSAEGLSAMAGDDSSMEIALAKSLIGRMKVDAARDWKKVTQNVTGNAKFARSVNRVAKLVRRQPSLFDF